MFEPNLTRAGLLGLDGLDDRPDLGLTVDQVTEYDDKFTGTVGVRFKDVVKWAAAETNVNRASSRRISSPRSAAAYTCEKGQPMR